jgi:Reverse transcriptase (RNA-dependent DNA polymerase)
MVDKKSLYERLGHFGEKAVIAGKSIKGYTTPFRLMPKRLCRGKKFRELIARHGDQKSIIETNYKPYGIPQGAPISDLLANLYLLDFDTTVAGWVRQLGGAYYRYSDDILIVVPGSEAVGRDLMAQTRGLIAKFGSKLEIKESKSSLFVFEQNGTDQNFQLLHGTQGKNGLEYLGFRYDGKHVYLRDATISNLRRKVARAAYRDADACARRYPDKDASKLKTFFNYERLIKQFGKVEDFDGQESDYRSWTFWTYASRASKIFGELGKTILRQLRKHRDLIRWRADRALELAVIRRDRRVARRPATK